MNMLYEGLKEKVALMLIPSSAVESMGMGGLMGAAAMRQTTLTRGESAQKPAGPAVDEPHLPATLSRRSQNPKLRLDYSRPCTGASGGDVHYLSVCGSGLLARVCLADVAGHGETIAKVGNEMHAHLLRSVDVIDERKVLVRLDRRLDASGLQSMTTAALTTYYPPSRRLTVAYAGHPPGWLYRKRDRVWGPLQTPAPPAKPNVFTDLPLGTGLSPVYTRHRFTVEPGDRMLLVTDGVLETTSPDDVPFDTEGVAALLEEDCDDCDGELDEQLRLDAMLFKASGVDQGLIPYSDAAGGRSSAPAATPAPRSVSE